MQTYTFNKNLPGGTTGYYGMPSPTAFARVLIATQGFAQLGLVTPDYVIPNGFLPLTNGTINYAGVDQVSYAALPTDGVSAINRSGMIVPNLATNFGGQIGIGHGAGGGGPQSARLDRFLVRRSDQRPGSRSRGISQSVAWNGFRPR